MMTLPQSLPERSEIVVRANCNPGTELNHIHLDLLCLLQVDFGLFNVGPGRSELFVIAESDGFPGEAEDAFVGFSIVVAIMDHNDNIFGS